ncbi:MAG TPA: hypothetical protein PKL83_00775 [bacterium]|nr:hypothetical protein [bacterium]
MSKPETPDTRYYLDLDLKKGSIIDWGYDDRFNLVGEELPFPQHRIFLSKGQYHKLAKKAGS